MAKYVIVGDPQIQITTPVSRTEKDFFKEVILHKLSQVRKIADDNKAGIIFLGDFFHKPYDKKVVPVELMHREISDTLRLKDNDVHTLIGNHDSDDINGSLTHTSLDVLVAAGLRTDCPMSKTDWFHYYMRDEFKKKSKDKKNKAKVAVIHDYIVPYNDRTKHLTSEDLSETIYNIVIAGHYHYAFEVQIGKTLYINPGAMTRLTSEVDDRNLKVCVLLFDDETLDIKKIYLDITPADKAFDLTKKIEKMEKEMVGAEFSAKLNEVRGKLNNDSEFWDIVADKLAKTKKENEKQYNDIMDFLKLREEEGQNEKRI